MTIYEAMQHHGTRYFEKEKVSVWVASDGSSAQIIDLSNAMQRGKACSYWQFSTTPYYTQADGMFISEYVELAYPIRNDSFADLIALLRSGAVACCVDHLNVSSGNFASMHVYSPFVAVKPVKLNLARLNASAVARAILAGQIRGGRVDEITTDDYAFDAAYDFQRGDMDIKAFAIDLIQSPGGWRFWSSKPGEITAACHTFDYRTLYIA